MFHTSATEMLQLKRNLTLRICKYMSQKVLKEAETVKMSVYVYSSNDCGRATIVDIVNSVFISSYLNSQPYEH